MKAFQQLVSAETIPATDELKIIEEIILWLPELAAQSELRESQWNPIDRSSEALLSWLRTADFSPGSRSALDLELINLNRAVESFQQAEAEFRRRLGGEGATAGELNPEEGE